MNLTRKQIEDSPAIESHKPVSRQYEEEYHRYYGWPYYWQGGGVWGMSGFPILELPPKPLPGEPAAAIGPQPERADAHLRNTQAVNGYHLQATDGIIGHVCDFMMDDKSWAIDRTGHQNRPPALRQRGADTDEQSCPDQFRRFHGVREFDQGSRRTKSRTPSGSGWCGRLPAQPILRFMKHNKFSQNQNQKPAGASVPAAVVDLNQNEIDFAPSPDEVARKAYFSYVNEGSLPGHACAALAGGRGGIDRGTQTHPGSWVS